MVPRRVVACLRIPAWLRPVRVEVRVPILVERPATDPVRALQVGAPLDMLPVRAHLVRAVTTAAACPRIPAWLRPAPVAAQARRPVMVQAACLERELLAPRSLAARPATLPAMVLRATLPAAVLRAQCLATLLAAALRATLLAAVLRATLLAMVLRATLLAVVLLAVVLPAQCPATRQLTVRLA